METGAGYEPQAWESFAVAEVGAAAAHSHSSTGVLAIGTKLLVPGVERVPLGIIMTVTGLALGLIVVRFSGINVTERQYRKPTLLTAGIAILLLTVSGASLALGAGGGPLLARARRARGVRDRPCQTAGWPSWRSCPEAPGAGGLGEVRVPERPPAR
jgi:hypothetical protein